MWAKIQDYQKKQKKHRQHESSKRQFNLQNGDETCNCKRLQTLNAKLRYIEIVNTQNDDSLRC